MTSDLAVCSLFCFTLVFLLSSPEASAIHGEARRKLSEGYVAQRHWDFVKAEECFLEALKQERLQGESPEAIDFVNVAVAANDASLGHASKAPKAFTYATIYSAVDPLR